MRSGFTLIELSIGLFLSSLIGTALYNSFFVTNRVISIADNFVTTDFRAVLIENQFEKDFAGVFIPEQSDAKVATRGYEKTKKNAEEKKVEEKNKGEQKQKEKKPIEKIFYASNGQRDALQLLTFITNNPVKIYEKAANVTPRPRIVRVVYRLIADEEDPESFRLLRQESPELDLKAFEPTAAKPIRGFEIASGVKSITCEYIFPVKKEEAQQAPKDKEKQQEKPKPEYKSVKQWDVDSKKDEKQEQPQIPEFIRCTCIFWDNKQREESFVFDFQIITFEAQLLPKEAEPKINKPQAQPKPEQGGAAANRPSEQRPPTQTPGT